MREVIGLIPAGGQATRIAPLPCSKELYPIGFRSVNGSQGLRPKVVCHYVLEKMRLAGIHKVYIVLRQGKWDIPAYLGDGSWLNMSLAYLMMHLPFGAPYTLDQAFPFVQNHIVALGFPDILFQSDDAFARLLRQQAITNADVVLGLFRTEQPQKADMVVFDGDGRVHEIIIKPAETNLHYAWVIAVWTPAFTRFMHEYLAVVQSQKEQCAAVINGPEQRELHVGDVIQAAIRKDLRVEAVVFSEHTFLDIGTPDNLLKAIREIVR